jgi:hypothetical protein
MPKVPFYRNKACAGSFQIRQRQALDEQCLATGMKDFNLTQIAVRVGMSCALTAVTAVGIFMVIRLVVGPG